MSERIVITGTNGLLGQKLVNLFNSISKYEVIAIARGRNRNNTQKGYRYIDLD